MLLVGRDVDIATRMRSRLWSFVLSRAFSTPIKATPDSLRLTLLNDLKASQVKVEDVSGGCGAAYSVYVESSIFKGMNMVAQHKLVTNSLREQIKDMHSITIKTKAIS